MSTTRIHPIPKQDADLYPTPHSDRPALVVDNEQFVRGAFAQSPNEGFEGLFRLYYKPLCSHILRFVYRQDVAEDIVSEVFYQFWKSGGYTSIQHTYRAYLYAAVRHRAYNYLRDELTGPRAPLSFDAVVLAHADESPQTIIEYDETVQRIEKIIHELPTQCQRMFLMSRFESRKNQEIADELGLSIKTIEAHISRALRQLRQIFLFNLLFGFIAAQGMQVGACLYS